MKKIFIVLLGTFIFFFNNASIADTSSITKELEANVLIEQETIEEQETLVEEQETLVEEQETEEIDDSIIIETSVPNEYVEETDNYETYSINYGTYGRLYVSWYDAALYDYNVYAGSSLSLQEIVDNYDSAAFYTSYDRLIIADHDTQGFSVLTDLYEGATSYIQFGDGSIIRYRLIQKNKGYNTGTDLVDTEGNSFFNMDSDLIMYTCYDDGIMVTLWVLA